MPQNVSPAPVGSTTRVPTPATSVRWSPWKTRAPRLPRVTKRSAPARVAAPSAPPNSTSASSALQKNRSASWAVASTVAGAWRTATPYVPATVRHPRACSACTNSCCSRASRKGTQYAASGRSSIASSSAGCHVRLGAEVFFEERHRAAVVVRDLEAGQPVDRHGRPHPADPVQRRRELRRHRVGVRGQHGDLGAGPGRGQRGVQTGAPWRRAAHRPHGSGRARRRPPRAAVAAPPVPPRATGPSTSRQRR